MRKDRRIVIILLVFLLALPTVAGVSNPDDFESYTPTINWQPTQAGEGWTLETINQTNRMGIYGLGETQGLRVEALDAGNGHGTWHVSLDKTTDPFQVIELDFYLDDGGPTYDEARIMINWIASSIYSTSFTAVFRHHSSMETRMYCGDGEISIPGGDLLTRDTWYRFQAELDYTNETVRCRFGPIGETFYDWTPTSAMSQTDQYSDIKFVFNGDLNLDNISLTAGSVILPLTASGPSPINNATYVSTNAVLSWTPGASAVSHRVYFGTNFADVNNASLAFISVNEPNYDPGTLEYNETYYWRVDEFNDPCLWPGQTWSFTTPAGPVICPDSDLTGDCQSDFNDLRLFAGQWLEDCSVDNWWCQGADFDQSSDVNAIDFALFAGDMSQAPLQSVSGVAYVYATFEMGPENPISGSVPKYPQIVSIGEKTGDVFVPAVNFGLGDDNRSVNAKMCPWATDGSINYYGPYMRPDTPYDFKIKLDMNADEMTIWVSGRGDDDWYLMAEDKPLINPVTSINHAEIIEDYPASVIDAVMVRSSQWAGGEQIRPHPLAKIDRVVMPGAGFQFRSMQSTWRKAGKHVTINRKEGNHYGFADVVQAGPDHLICVWQNGSHTGSGSGGAISHSYDLGQTWSTPVSPPAYIVHCPRIQKLNDGILLLLSDAGGGGPWGNWDVVFYDSNDGGHTWTNQRWLDTAGAGESWAMVPGHVYEANDGSWLIVGSEYGSGNDERLKFFRSYDRGYNWQYVTTLLIEPPHNLSEADIVGLPDGRIMTFARDWRADAMPGVKAFSSDNGDTWTWQELPFPITGRTCTKMLNDGRVMTTFRSGVGNASLRGWVGDPDDPNTFQPAGGHFNDRYSVAMKDGALHIDNDGRRGQFTMYHMRPPDTYDSTVDVTAEVKVLRNDGYAATLTVPFAGKLRIFPDHVEMAHDAAIRVDVTPGIFHTYRIISQVGRMRLYVDGALEFDGDIGDDRVKGLHGEISTVMSYYSLDFGNEQWGRWSTQGEVSSSEPDVFQQNISSDTTGYSIWKRVEEVLDDPTTGHREYSWIAATDGFPDTHQMDHIIEIEASISGHEQGYSGWIQLDDGRIFVVNYTDDTADASTSPHYNMGVPWIRGTFLELSDLPPASPAGP